MCDSGSFEQRVSRSSESSGEIRDPPAPVQEALVHKLEISRSADSCGCCCSSGLAPPPCVGPAPRPVTAVPKDGAVGRLADESR